MRFFLPAIPLLFVAVVALAPPRDAGPTEAPASFQLVTNGFTSQADFNDALEDFTQDAQPNPGAPGMLTFF